MSLRKLTALTALISFVLLLLTSVILYIVPHGRVAYWAGWELWGLSKTQWTDTHVTLGVLFLVAIGLHIYYNWKPITNYLKNKAKQMQVFTTEFTVALALVFMTVVGTLMHVPPFVQILNLGAYFKDQGTLKYGDPPYGQAQLSSLSTFAKKVGVDLDLALERLEAAGVEVDEPSQTLEVIGKNNDQAPQQVYDIIFPPAERNAAFSGEAQDLPDSLPPGSGNLPLADLISKYNLNFKVVERGLAERGIDVTAEQTLKEIGEANSMAPVDVYLVIREIATVQ